jgi:adenylate cyclase class 1
VVTVPTVPLAEEIDRKGLAAIRERFLRLQGGRLRRIRAALSDAQADLLELLPLLLHVNHPRLPGFVGTDAPAGIPAYQPGEATLLCARGVARTFRYQRHRLPHPPILGLYLMGSLGSLGHCPHSDFDVWLCHDPRLDAEAVAALRAKVGRIEDYGREQGVEINVFLIDVEAFRRGSGQSALSEQSSGSTQHRLLLDEFYRSGVRLAGRTPLWWLVPPGRGADYAEYTRHLLVHRFVDPGHWLDFGALDNPSADEFFGAAHWQLYKGIDAPYKSLLKILLMEAYAADFPDLRWLSEDLKAAVYAGREDELDELDPYRMLLARVERHLAAAGESDRRDLARRALYIKAELPLSTYRGLGWKAELLRRLVAGWGWDVAKLERLDRRRSWQIEAVREESDLLVAELSRSYRLVTEFAQRHAAGGGIDPLEVNLLGRKLYSALERRPGKIEWMNLSGEGNLAEPRLVLRPGRGGGWRLDRDRPGPEATPLKTADSLVEAIAWAHLNGVLARGTHIAREAPEAAPGHGELQRVRAALWRLLPGGERPAAPLRALAEPLRAEGAAAIVNLGVDPHAHLAKVGLQITTTRSDPLCFGSARDCLVQALDYVVLTSWGEVYARRFEGADGLLEALCQHLGLTWPDRGAGGGLHCHGLGGPRAGLVARRVEALAAALRACFDDHGEHARCLVAVGPGYYLVQRDGGRFRWHHADDERSLLELLAEPLSIPRPVVPERRALAGSPLAAVLQTPARGGFRVFFRPRPQAVELYVLDELGSLFHQEAVGEDEAHLLVHLRRFLDSLGRRRSAQSAAAARRWLEGETTFHRLVRRGGGWHAVPAHVATSVEHLELVLIDDRPHGGFRLRCGDAELDSQVLGDGIYAAVVDQVVRHRRGGVLYPIYLTGAASAGLPEPGGSSPMPLLVLKRRIEGRLNSVLARLRG